MLGAPQAKILWPAPSKSRFYYVFWLLELMPGHVRRSILRILVLNPTHEISWSRSGFFSLRGRILRAGPPGPPLFFVFCFQPSLACSRCPGRPLTERSKNIGPALFPENLSCQNWQISWKFSGNFSPTTSAYRQARLAKVPVEKKIQKNQRNIG